MRPLWWMRGVLREENSGEGGGGGGDKAPAFDSARFKTEILGEVGKLFKGLEARLPKPDDSPAPNPDPDPNPGDKAKDPAVKALEKKLADQQKALDQMKTEAETARSQARAEKRNTVLTTELGKLGVPPERMKSAIRALDPDVKWSDDGSLVGDDDTPLSEYLGAWVKGNEHFLPPKNVGGSGATSGGRQAQAVDINDIKPGMKGDDLARARAEIARVARETLQGR